MKPELLYLDLLKKTLSYMLWPEPEHAVKAEDYADSRVKRAMFARAERWLAGRRMRIVKQPKLTEEQRETGQIWPERADTMIGLKRLDNLQFCVEDVLRRQIEGDFIETGVWRGGASIFMRAVLAAYDVTDRKVYVADSFQGLPKPDPQKHPADKDDPLHQFSELAISLEQVRSNFDKYGLLDEQVVFVKGWFAETLHKAPIDKLAVLRLDGDMYGSTIDALEALYPKLSPGGYCIIDDYALTTCKQAVDDYCAGNRIDVQIKPIDWTGAYWQKP